MARTRLLAGGCPRLIRSGWSRQFSPTRDFRRERGTVVESKAASLGSAASRRLTGAVRAARDSQAEALNVFSSPVLSLLHREIIAFAVEYRLPAIYQWKEHC